MSGRDLRALEALSACLQMTKGEALREALREAALRRGVWNVGADSLEAAAQPLLTEMKPDATD